MRLSGTIPSFGREAADYDNRCVGILSRLRQQICRKFGLNCEPRCFSFLALPGNIFLVERGKRSKQMHLSLTLLDSEPVQDAADIGACYIAASSSAFHIVGLSFSEECNFIALPKRQNFFIIF